MNIDNSILLKYILINTDLKPSYAFISKTTLTEHEANCKNYAFGLNGINKKWILEEDWK
tara:strand:+ start:294 stop:470 length:177 start_codon:yes stop_codon:yes gene_type:complete